jgi:hypothetical protein
MAVLSVHPGLLTAQAALKIALIVRLAMNGLVLLFPVVGTFSATCAANLCCKLVQRWLVAFVVAFVLMEPK